MQIRNEWFEKKCREHNLKVTPQRSLIYKVLSESDDHPSTETVHRRVREYLPSVSLDTVNRTLITFNEIGLVFVVEGSGDVRRYDAGLGTHQHFKCIRCKRIIDFHYKPFDEIETPKELEGKFKILRKTVYFEGLCENCMKNNNNK